MEDAEALAWAVLLCGAAVVLLGLVGVAPPQSRTMLAVVAAVAGAVAVVLAIVRLVD